MHQEDAGPPGIDARARDAASAEADAVHAALGVYRQLRARDRGHLAGLLHDGPMQDLAAIALELGTADGGEGMLGRVDGVGRDLRSIQDELWPFPPAGHGLVETVRQRTAWLLDSPPAVAAGDGTASLTETDVQAVADVAELTLAGLEAPAADGRPIMTVRADQNLIFLELNLTPAPGLDLSADGPAVEAWLHRVSAATGTRGRASLGRHRLRLRIEIPRCPTGGPGERDGHDNTIR